MAQKLISSVLQLIQALKSENEEDILLKADMTISQPITITANKKITTPTNKIFINISGGLTITKGEVEISGGLLQINADNAIIVNGSANPSELICRATAIQVINSGSISYRTKGKITLYNANIANESTSPAFKGQYTDAVLKLQECATDSTKAPLASVQNGAKVELVTGRHKFLNLSENKDQPMFIANGNNSSISIHNSKCTAMSAYLMKLENGATGNISGIAKIEVTGPEEYDKPAIKIDGTGNTFKCSCELISSAHGPILETTSPGNTIKIVNGQIIAQDDVECLVMPAGNTLELTALFTGILKNDYLPQTHEWSAKGPGNFQTVILKPVAPPPPPQPKGNVYVHYKDTEGNELKTSVKDMDQQPVDSDYDTKVDNRPNEIVKDGKTYVLVPAGNYTVGQVDAEGHLESSDPIIGKVAEQDKNVTYIYKLKPVAPPPPPQPPVNPPGGGGQPQPGGGGTQPPQPPNPPQPQELGKSLNIIRTVQLYQTPSRRYPISEWEGPVQILSEPITEQGTGEKFILVRVKLQGIGTWLTSYIRWNTTTSTPIADEFLRR